MAQSKSIAELFIALDRDYRLRQRKSYAQAKSHWKKPVECWGKFPAEYLTDDDIQAYVLDRQTQGASNATINRELSGLKRAMKLGKIQWPGFEFLPESGVRQGTYTREEVERLAMALPEHVRPVLWFGYYTGRRKSEILAIKWEDVDWNNGWITIKASITKTGQPDRLPLSGELESIVRSLPGGPAGTPIFKYQGRSFRTFARSWRSALKSTGLKDKLFHDLRRTAVTDMEDAGVPRGTAMAITGHKTFSVYQRYNIVRQDSMKEGLETLQNYREKR